MMPTKGLVVSIHGIRTGGTWQKDLSESITNAGYTYVPLDFGWFRAIQLVLPGARTRKVQWLRDTLYALAQEHPTRLSIVAHSFGTYLVARVLEDYPEAVSIENLILCGSIVRRKYPWPARFRANSVGRCLNDIGTRDIWSRAAEWAIADAGSSGYEGFDDSVADPRLFQSTRRYGHSQWFHRANYEQRWLPFLQGRDPAPLSELPLPAPNWRFRLAIVLLTAALCAAGLGAYHVMGRWHAESSVQSFLKSATATLIVREMVGPALNAVEPGTVMQLQETSAPDSQSQLWEIYYPTQPGTMIARFAVTWSSGLRPTMEIHELRYRPGWADEAARTIKVRLLFLQEALLDRLAGAAERPK